MKSGWHKRKIGEVCHLMTGGTPSRTNPDFFGGDIRWLVSGDIHKGEILDCDGRITKAGMNSCNAKLLPVDSVMIALNGQGKTRGTVAILRVPATCNQSLVSICPNDPKRLLPEFLYANLLGRYQEIRQMTGDSGNDRRGLNMGLIANIEVPIAPLPEQQRIVGILDEAFDVIATAKANTEKNLANARALFESHLQAVFTQRGEGWVEKQLGELIAIQNGFAFKSGEYADSGYFVMRIGNVQHGGISLDNPRYIRLADKKLERFVLNEGDILVSLTGNIGRVGMVQPEHLPAVLNQRVARITVDGGRIDRAFLFRFLSSRTFRDGLQHAGHGAAQQNVSTTEIETVRICLPAIDQQRRMAERFESFAAETQRLESLCQQKLAALDALKKSVLHQAFTGRLLNLSKSECVA